MTLAIPPCWRYGLPVTVNPVADLGRSFNLARRRPIPLQALFCVCTFELWRLCVGHLRVCRVPSSRSANPRTAASPNSLGRERWQLHIKLGASPMTTRNPSKARASAHRAMALAALRSNSSLSVRLNRYNHHRAIQRALEAQTDACDWLENLEGDAWADACEEIAAALKAKEVSHA